MKAVLDGQKAVLEAFPFSSREGLYLMPGGCTQSRLGGVWGHESPYRLTLNTLMTVL